MTNVGTNEEIIIEEVDTLEPEFTPEQLADDKTDWKAIAEDLKGKNQRRAAKLAKARERLSQKTPIEVRPEPKAEPKSSDLDYGQKAFLKSYGIAGSDELALVKEFQANTGKQLDELVDNKYFNNSLNELREARATKQAIPSGTKSVGSSKEPVEYWTAKYDTGTQLNDIPEEYRSAVLNSKLKMQRTGSKFSSRPIIGG